MTAETPTHPGADNTASASTGWRPSNLCPGAHQDHLITERHFDSEAELRAFIAEVAAEYRADADDYGEYEAATALYDDHDLCPWSITTHLKSTVPFNELSGPDPREMLVHEACLCIESVLTDIYTDAAD